MNVVDLFDRRGAGSRPGGATTRAGEDETLLGTVERVVYSGGEGSFTVARLKLDRDGEVVTVVGSLVGVPAGASLRLMGRFETTARFGAQFRITHYTEVAPATLEGLRRYLGSGLIKGIGPELASRIVDRFGIETLEVLDREPSRIGEVPGIGQSRARAVRDAWNAQRAVREVMVFLQGYGVSPAFAARIYKRYGAASIARVRENPYRLAFDIWGIGFLSADKLAAALGVAPDAPTRLEAGVRHVLDDESSNGHVFVPRARLAGKAAALLDQPEAEVTAAIDRLARAGEAAIDTTVVDDPKDPAVYETLLYRAETALAAGLRRLLDAPAPPLAVEADKALAWYEREAGIALARQQAEAVKLALTAKVAVVTGGPGVGKTTIVRGIVSILKRKGLTVALAAPTGRAAKRLADATGAPASTLHRLLEWRPASASFGRCASNPLEADVLIVDEASMLDVRLGADLVAALAPSARLVLVGDVDQLPSVGPGTVLADVIASGAAPTVRLTEIFRQAAESLIVVNAHRIQEGAEPELGAAAVDRESDRRDFFFLEEDDPAAAAVLIRDLVAVRLPRRYGFSSQEIQVLSPMHRGELGAANLNRLLQETLTAGAAGIERGQRMLRVGDKVMQVKNDYDKEVWNGDSGIVEGVAAETLSVRFDDRLVEYSLDELDALVLAYAATVHKSQGSEYPAVIIPVHTQHYVMLQRNLLYTAVTRGKRLVVLVGTRKALALAVRNAEVAARASGLAARLRASRR
ncbi:MAG TPA: ATP-dependent RecD-like DNA helicase [Polyangia bacterium]|jgi:exodeoxyribonuclease V alpha subunit|nr:ATP-dependent RecD-like DNA helicase [Polyangia bacterium]